MKQFRRPRQHQLTPTVKPMILPKRKKGCGCGCGGPTLSPQDMAVLVNAKNRTLNNTDETNETLLNSGNSQTPTAT